MLQTLIAVLITLPTSVFALNIKSQCRETGFRYLGSFYSCEDARELCGVDECMSKAGPFHCTICCAQYYRIPCTSLPTTESSFSGSQKATGHLVEASTNMTSLASTTKDETKKEKIWIGEGIAIGFSLVLVIGIIGLVLWTKCKKLKLLHCRKSEDETNEETQTINSYSAVKLSVEESL